MSVQRYNALRCENGMVIFDEDDTGHWVQWADVREIVEDEAISRLRGRISMAEMDVEIWRQRAIEAGYEPENWVCKGARAEDIVTGTRVRYYPVRGEPEFAEGWAHSRPWRLNDYIVVHIRMVADRRTVHSVDLRHLEVVGS